MADIRTKYRAYVADDADSWPAIADPQARAQPHHATSRRRSPRRTRRARRARTSPRAPQVWTRAELEQKAPGIDWARAASTPPSSAARRSSTPITPARSRSCRRWSAPSRSTLEGLAGLPHAQPASRTCCRKPIRDASFAFNGTALNGAEQQRPRDKRALNAVSNALQDAVGKVYVDKYFPASAKAEIQEMVDNIKAAFARASRRIDWMAPRPRQEALKKVADDRRRRRLSRHLARLFGAARSAPTTPTPTRRAAEPGRYQPADREDRQADGPQRMVDDAAAGQRGQPAGAERAQLPGGDPAAAILRPEGRRRRSTMARSAR